MNQPHDACAPLVSVVLSVHNGVPYLQEAIESILGQSYDRFEVVVIDDGSTDDSAGIVGSFSDARIRYFRNDANLGLARSLNRGLSLARGSVIARQDADDISEPTRLERQIALLHAQPELALVGTGYREIDELGHLVGTSALPADHVPICWSLLFFCPFVHSSVTFRRDAIRGETGAGPYDESLAYSMDYDLWRRIAASHRVANLPESLVRLRSHPRSMTATFGERTKEGWKMRVAAVGRLLGWDANEADQNGARFDELYTFLFGDLCRLSGEVIRLQREVMRLYSAFCRSSRLSMVELANYHVELEAFVSRRVLLARQLAERAIDDADHTARFSHHHLP